MANELNRLGRVRKRVSGSELQTCKLLVRVHHTEQCRSIDCPFKSRLTRRPGNKCTPSARRFVSRRSRGTAFVAGSSELHH